jgi:hypothetical protein
MMQVYDDFTGHVAAARNLSAQQVEREREREREKEREREREREREMDHDGVNKSQIAYQER